MQTGRLTRSAERILSCMRNRVGWGDRTWMGQGDMEDEDVSRQEASVAAVFEEAT